MRQGLEQQILHYAASENLSDIHIHAGNSLALRVDGKIVRVENSLIGEREIEIFANRNLSREALESWREDRSVDVNVTCGKYHFRANFYFASGQPALVLRYIKEDIPSLEALGLPENIKTLLDKRCGLILVSGATGAGKSTTLAAMMQYLLESDAVHAITIEDPIEFKFRSSQSVISQRQVGSDANCFASALRSALREDFDIMLVGEMRDLETIELALTASELGHLVMGTLHASSCTTAVARIINAFPVNFRDCVRSRVADSLELVISQRLLKRADTAGRIAAFEVLVATPAVRNLIRENKVFHLPSVIETSKSEGMMLMDAAMRNLQEVGKVNVHAV